jgi:hypothetical protein
MNENNLSSYESQEQHVETIISQAPSETITLTDAYPSANRWESFSLGMILAVWVTLFLRRLLIQKKKPYLTKPPRCHQAIPCKNCRFTYHNFLYVKCAIHPSKAMKKEAIGCSDYWAKDSDTFSQ